MSRLWTPPKVSRELEEGTKEHNAQVLSMMDLNYGILDKWNRELKKLDPMLRLGRAKPSADPVIAEPNYYYLIRINHGAPIWYVPLHDGNGGFVEPTNAMLDMLRASDMQNPQVTRAREEDKRKAETRKEIEKQNRREMRDEILMEKWRAHDRPKYNFDPEVKWSHSTDGKRGRKAD